MTAQQLGQLVRSRRKQLRVTQPELAMVSGTGVRFIVDLERGKPTCQLGKALFVLEMLGLSLEAKPKSAAVDG